MAPGMHEGNAAKMREGSDYVMMHAAKMRESEREDYACVKTCIRAFCGAHLSDISNAW